MDLIKYNDFTDLQKNIDKFFDIYSMNTKKSYMTDIKDFIETININVFEATPQDIIDYITALNDRGVSNATYNRKLYSLSKVIDIFILNGLMKSNPVKTIKLHKKIDKPIDKTIYLNINVEDVKHVIEISKPTIALLISFLTNTGCRISEMLSIKIDDIKDENGTYKLILLRGKGNKDRTIYLNSSLYDEIRKIYHQDSEYLFHTKSGKPLGRGNTYNQIHRTFLKIGKEVNPHKLRHLFCQTKINKEKQDIKAVSLYVGHSNVNITLDFYCKSTLKPEQTNIL